MNKLNWKQKKYTTWDEAFKGMIPPMRQQSVRVADYTQVLFERACAADCYTKGDNVKPYMNSEFAEVAYKCGLYHQIGKSTIPPEYQTWKKTFVEEEKVLYRRYTTEGRALLARLQGWDEAKEEDMDTSSLMIQQAAEQHMERWNGTGYPAARTGEDISLIAQIVGLAKELDRLVTERRSEKPFEEAVDMLLLEAGKAFSPELLGVLKSGRGELRAIYKKYIQYSKTLPKTIPLVDKRAERPFGLKYRPLILEEEESTGIYEAMPWFGAVADKPDEREALADVEELLTRTGLLNDVSYYLLYEAADAILRMQNCNLPTEGIVVPMFAGFFLGEDQWPRLEQLYEDQPVDKKKLMLAVPDSVMKDIEIATINRLAEYIEKGVVLVLDDYHPDHVSFEKIQEIGFTHVRLASELGLKKSTKALVEELHSHGITAIGRTLVAEDYNEDELIRSMLVSE